MSARRKYTIVAVAGDNGSTSAIGLFGSRERAEQQAAEWQAADNPEVDPDGMHYSAHAVQTVREWAT